MKQKLLQLCIPETVNKNTICEWFVYVDTNDINQSQKIFKKREITFTVIIIILSRTMQD